MFHIDYPFRFDDTGRTAGAATEKHIRNMIEQLLLTSPGERVNRPDFGSGLQRMVFEPNSPELGAVLQMTTQAALQQHLGDLIEVQDLSVSTDDSTLRVEVLYRVRATNEIRTETFEQASVS